MFRVLWTERAERDITRLDAALRRRIGKAVERLERDPLASARKLTDSALGEYRLRVGDWRVVFDVHGPDVVILRVGHRREIYRR